MRMTIALSRLKVKFGISIEKNFLKGEEVELRLQEYKLSGMTEHYICKIVYL